jgi:hypothetical protein
VPAALVQGSQRLEDAPKALRALQVADGGGVERKRP